MTDITHRSVAGLIENDSTTYRGIFVASFAVYFAIAVLASLLMWKWRSWLPGAEGEKSLIHGVKDGVYTFMSYLT